MCDVLSGGPGMCDEVWQGEGVKLAKNSVTYFMDGPKEVSYTWFSFELNSQSYGTATVNERMTT